MPCEKSRFTNVKRLSVRLFGEQGIPLAYVISQTLSASRADLKAAMLDPVLLNQVSLYIILLLRVFVKGKSQAGSSMKCAFAAGGRKISGMHKQERGNLQSIVQI